MTAPLLSSADLGIDTARARALDGCVDVLTHENAQSDPAGGVPHPAAGTGRAFRRPAGGDGAGGDAGSGAGRGRAGRGALRADAGRHGNRPGARRGFAPRTAGLTATDSRRGAPEAALAAAAVTLGRRYTTPTHDHLAIEPQAVLADCGRLDAATGSRASTPAGPRADGSPVRGMTDSARWLGWRLRSLRRADAHGGGGIGACRLRLELLRARWTPCGARQQHGQLAQWRPWSRGQRLRPSSARALPRRVHRRRQPGRTALDRRLALSVAAHAPPGTHERAAAQPGAGARRRAGQLRAGDRRWTSRPTRSSSTRSSCAQRNFADREPMPTCRVPPRHCANATDRRPRRSAGRADRCSRD